MGEFVIETVGLTKRFGPVAAVEEVSLQVERGKVFGLLGPNGAGKTTTMGMVLGLVRPTAGSIRLFGEALDVSGRSALSRIGAIVESPAFYPYMSGRANLRYFQGIAGGSSPAAVDRLLDLVGLAERANSRFRTYSLGMKQRLGLAYALLGDPELLILDEPTNGMDPAGMVEVRELIRRLGDDGYTVLLSSHLLNEVEQVCDSVAIMSHGRLIAQGAVDELTGGQETLTLRTTDDAEAAGVVSAIPWVSEVRAQDGGLVVAAPTERAAEVSATLGRQGIYITEMGQTKESLEQYFLEVTGGNGHAEVEQP